MITGYSDRINHALAFAAKHHDRQVRKGARLPYLTGSANVAIILTRYGRDDTTVVAGIIHDVVEDAVHERHAAASLTARVAEKFGDEVLNTALAVTPRLVDDDGVELSQDEGRDDYITRLASAAAPALWVCAAGEVHTAATLLTDLRRTIDPDTVWSRLSAGKAETVRWHRRVYDRLAEVGFAGDIMIELAALVQALEQWFDPAAPRPTIDPL